LGQSLYYLRNYKGTEYSIDKMQILIQVLSVLAYASVNIFFQESEDIYQKREFVLLYIKLVCDSCSLLVLQLTLITIANLQFRHQTIE